MRTIPIVIYCLVVFSVPAAGQTTGTVQGTVTDPQNAVLAAVTVELLQPATNTTRTVETTAAGSYVFDYLQPAVYVVKVSAQGFKTATVENVVVEATKTASVNVELQVGELSEVVQVKAVGQRVDTVSPQVATTVEQRFLRDLPSYSRNVLTYAAMQPGVEVNTNSIAGGSQMLNASGTRASVNGNRSQRNGFYLDGMESGNWRNEALQMPNPDAVQEVQISTSNTSAEYGRQVGGVFNVIAKSGTNTFKGAAFYFSRLKDLNAKPWGVPANFEKPDQNQKLSGGVLGGPIVKNRSFFFFSYDRFTDEAAVSLNRSFVPTAAMVSGDFSALPNIIYDPATGQPFPGNIIPAGAQDPVGRNLIRLLPTVGTYGDIFVWSFVEPAKNQTLYAKGDHHWTNAHTTAFTWMRSNGNATYPAVDGRYSQYPAWGPQVNEAQQNQYNGRHTWVVRNNMVADFRLGYAKAHVDRDNPNFKTAFPDATTDVLRTLGARNTDTVQDGAQQYLPFLELPSGIAHEGWLGLFDQPTFQFGGTVSWVKSKHSVKLGADAVRRGQHYAVSGAGPSPNWLRFDGRFSSRNASFNDNSYALADMLLGRATYFQQQGVIDFVLESWDNFFFVQDEWKITPRLTLSPGLRYEFYLPPSVSGDQRTEYFTTNPVQGSISTYQSTRFPNAPPGLAFEGDPGVPSGFFKTERNLIAPRLGAAWDVFGDGRTAVRAGAGKFYGSTSLGIKSWPSEQTPWQPSAACLGNTIASNPWLGCEANTFTAPPTPFSSSSSQNFVWPNPVPLIHGVDPNFKTAYSYQWNVSAERELTKGLTVQVGYIGNRGRNQTALEPINFAPFTPAADNANVQARRPNQGYGPIYIATSKGKSSYNGLQSVATVRWGERLLSRFIYSYQRGYAECDDDPLGISQTCHANPLNPAGEWGENQRHHVFKLFYSWNLPFLERDNWYSKAFGGWQLSGSATVSSGFPGNVTLGGNDWNYDGISGDRPDRAGEIQYPKQDVGNRTWQWLSPSGFTLPGGGANHNTFGNLPRNAVFGPGFWTADAALLKNFHIDDSRYVQFRFEAYNVFNHATLNGPNLNFGSPTFGQIVGKSGHRLVQLGLKFYF